MPSAIAQGSTHGAGTTDAFFSFASARAANDASSGSTCKLKIHGGRGFRLRLPGSCASSPPSGFSAALVFFTSAFSTARCDKAMKLRSQWNFSTSRHDDVYGAKARRHLVAWSKNVDQKRAVIRREPFFSPLNFIDHQPHRAVLGENFCISPVDTTPKPALDLCSRRHFFKSMRPPRAIQITGASGSAPGELAWPMRLPGDKHQEHHHRYDSSFQRIIPSVRNYQTIIIALNTIPQCYLTETPRARKIVPASVPGSKGLRFPCRLTFPHRAPQQSGVYPHKLHSPRAPSSTYEQERGDVGAWPPLTMPSPGVHGQCL